MLNVKSNLIKALFLSVIALSLVLLLPGCSGPKTPQDVAKSFWQAVIENNAANVAEYSTLSKPEDFNGFSMDWHGYKPAWGKVVIDGDQASIETVFTGPTDKNKDKRHCVTYLVHRDNMWKVDYKLTQVSLTGGALGSLIGSINQLGDQLSKNLDSSMKQLDVEMERLGRKFKEMADNVSQHSSKIIQQHAQNLQNIIKELEDSINQALEDRQNNLSDRDKQVMKGVVSDLETSKQRLDSPSTETITQSNSDMGLARQHLDTVNSGKSDDYKDRWDKIFKEFEQSMQSILDEFARAEKQNHKP